MYPKKGAETVQKNLSLVADTRYEQHATNAGAEVVVCAFTSSAARFVVLYNMIKSRLTGTIFCRVAASASAFSSSAWSPAVWSLACARWLLYF